MPFGLTTPIPVITTRRLDRFPTPPYYGQMERSAHPACLPSVNSTFLTRGRGPFSRSARASAPCHECNCSLWRVISLPTSLGLYNREFPGNILRRHLGL